MAEVDTAISELGQYLANFAILLDLERIIIGGALMNDADRILPALQYRPNRVVPFPPDAVPGAFTADAAPRGAAELLSNAANNDAKVRNTGSHARWDQVGSADGDAAARLSWRSTLERRAT